MKTVIAKILSDAHLWITTGLLGVAIWGCVLTACSAQRSEGSIPACAVTEYGQSLAHFACAGDTFGSALAEYRMHHAKIINVFPVADWAGYNNSFGATTGIWVVTE
jgi:hypothetical protein